MAFFLPMSEIDDAGSERPGIRQRVLLWLEWKIAGTLAAICVVSLAVAVAAVAGRFGVQARAQAAERAFRSVSVATESRILVAELDRAAAAFVAYGDEASLWSFREAAARVASRAADGSVQVTDGPARHHLQSLQAGIRHRLEAANALVAARQAEGAEAARELFARSGGVADTYAFENATAELIADADRLAAESRRHADDRATQVYVAIGVAGAVLLGFGVGGIVFVRRGLLAARLEHSRLHSRNARLERRVADQMSALEASNARLSLAYQELRLLLEQAPMAVAMLDTQMRYVATNPRWGEIFRQARADLTGKNHYAIHPETPAPWRELHRRVLSGERVETREDEWIANDGSKHWLRWAASPWRDEHGIMGGIILFAEDITARRIAEQRLRLADAVFRNAQEGIVITDLEGTITAVNPAFMQITEYAEAELVGANMRLLKSGRHAADFYREMWQAIRTTGTWQGEIWDRRKGGEIFQQWLGIGTVTDEQGVPTHLIGVLTDISRMRHAQTYLEFLAHHDALTGLPNRVLLRARLTHALQRSRRSGAGGALMLVDLDGFKAVNDSLGHEAGDAVLQQLARRMTRHVRESDTVARFGGDEFAVVLEEITSPEDAARVAEAIVADLGRPCVLPHGPEVQAGASIGIGLFGGDRDDVEALLRSADGALYRSKKAGRGTWRFADAEPAAPGSGHPRQLAGAVAGGIHETSRRNRPTT